MFQNLPLGVGVRVRVTVPLRVRSNVSERRPPETFDHSTVDLPAQSTIQKSTLYRFNLLL